MATIHQLEREGVLARIQFKLTRFEFPSRELYASPGLVEWIKGPLHKMKPIDNLNSQPREQAHALLKKFVLGGSFTTPRMFRQLRPLESDVYELKTPDLRFFGWFHQRDRFLAICAEHIEVLKEPESGPLRYDALIREVCAFRDTIDLDEPKCLTGARVSDVISL
jgi:hypothetical protein